MLAQATLASEVENMVPVLNAVTAAQTMAQAYGNYFKTAMAGVVPIIPAAIDSVAVPAMATALVFVTGDTATQGATKVVTGLAAFWASMVTAPASFFAGATLITPPLFAALVTTLASDFSANTNGSKTLADSASAIATSIHNATASQGSATFPGPVVSTIV